MIDVLTHVASFKAYEAHLLTCHSPKLFVVDIKAFKHINLSYGDEAGNALLQHVASKLLRFASENDMALFRLRNDQFILLADMAFELSRMEKLIFSLCDVIKKQTFIYEEMPIDIEMHMGISFDHFNPLEKALKSLWVAKTEDQPFVSYSEFANSLANESEEKVEELLKEAIEHERVLLFFQGVFDVSHECYYYESLIRMDCQHGLQSPKLFLKIARERHVYDLLLAQIVQKIITLSSTQRVPLALNLSSFDLLDEARVAFLKDALAHTAVILEVQCEDNAHVTLLKTIFPRFKEVGIRIALDNVEHPDLIDAFDAGVVDVVKVHGDLIRNLFLDEEARLTCTLILEAAHTKGAKSVATHLNAKGALTAIQTLPFDLFQGYSFEQPHPLS